MPERSLKYLRSYPLLVFVVFLPNPAVNIAAGYGLTLAHVFACLVVLESRRIHNPKLIGLVAAFLACFIVSGVAMFFLSDFGPGSETLNTIVGLLLCLLPLIALAFVPAREAVSRAQFPLMLGILFTAAAGEYQRWRFADGVFPWKAIFNNGSFAAIDFEVWELYIRRPLAFFPEPSALVSVVGPATLWLLYRLLRADLRNPRFGVLAILAGTYCVLTSKSTFIPIFFALLLIQVIVAALVSEKRGYRLVARWAIALGLVLLGVALVLADRLAAVLNSSALYRAETLKGGVDLWVESWGAFFLGGGPGSTFARFAAAGAPYDAVHSVILAQIVQVGLPVALVWGYVLFGVARSRVWLAGMALLLAMGVVTSYPTIAGLWLLLGLVVLDTRAMPARSVTGQRDGELRGAMTLGAGGRGGRDRMRVVHVIPTLNTGGAERVLTTVASDQVKAGHEVLVITLDADTTFGAELRTAGVQVVDHRGYGRGRLALVRAMAGLLLSMASLRADVVVGWLYHGALAAALTGPRVRRRAVSLHHRDPRDPGVKRGTRAVFRAVVGLSRRIDLAVYVSEGSRAHHEDAGLRVSGVVVPVGVDTQRHALVADEERGTAREALALPALAPVIAHVARIHPDKGQEVLLAAFAALREQYRDAVLLVAGSGWTSDASAPVDLAGASGLDGVVLLGEVSDPRAVLAGADVFCLSSHTEALPVALVEAMCSGLLPVVTDVGACAEATSTHGFVAPPGDPAALAQELARAVAAANAEPERRGAVREHAVTTFDAATMCRAYRDLIVR